jgi:formamidase
MAHHRIDAIREGEGERNGHNRWHPHIKPELHIDSGDTVTMTTIDAADGQLHEPMTTDDMKGNFTPFRVHPLTGPLYVNDAEPGDLLAVHIDEIIPGDIAFTLTAPGRGFLPDEFTGPILAHWRLEDGFARSPQLPGIAIPAAPFMGTIGVAPTLDQLRAVNVREKAAADGGALVMFPLEEWARPADPAISSEAWRTTGAHEVGGNMDIRQLVAGTTAYFPVEVAGALFSAGDAHFAQGDGETCGTAIEMSSTFTARYELIKGEAARRGQIYPTFTEPALPERTVPATKGWYSTTALSVVDGQVFPLDATVAAKNALRLMVDALCLDYGYTRNQAYLIASVAGDLKISSIVNVPYAQVSMSLPLDIFEN